MVSFKSSTLLFAVAAVASALTTPHHARSAHQHHAIAARIASPNVLDIPQDVSLKRSSSLRKRCKARTSSKPATLKPSTPAVVGNVGTDPDIPASPTPTTHHDDPTPAKSTKAAATPKSTQKSPAPPPPTTNGPSWLTGPNSGDGTFYGTGLGACGITNHDTDFIVAVSHLLFDNYPGYVGGNPNNNPICGRKIIATYQGKSVTVTVTDRCVGCKVTDLDFSPTAFNNIGDPTVGRLHGVSWVWA